MRRPNPIAPAMLFIALTAVGLTLAAVKRSSLEAAATEAAATAVATEAVRAARAAAGTFRPTATAIGTVQALRSITLRNEVAGTIAAVHLEPGAVVEAGDVLVALDVSVEQAELEAYEAEARLAATVFRRAEALNASRALSDEELDHARAERDVAQARVERTRALIERKTMRAPFRGRVGLADLHVGQYLGEGTLLTTLQSIDDEVHVEFSVPQHIAATLAAGDSITIDERQDPRGLEAAIVAVDARVDPATRHAAVRARLTGRSLPAPGASVQVTITTGPSDDVVTVPVTALRKGPGGDHVFVLEPRGDGQVEAVQRAVASGPVQGGDVVIRRGLAPGELVAASGSFKLADQALVAIDAGGRTRASLDF